VIAIFRNVAKRRLTTAGDIFEPGRRARNNFRQRFEMAIDPLNDYKTYPSMVHWFSPVLLLKLLNNVVTSAMFGQYADRRLIVAALDTVSEAEHVKRAREAKLAPDGDQAVWIDFVADLGDGFDSTYAVASLLARKELEFEGSKLPRGQVLIMGGDEVYPLANEQTYRNQLYQPYAWAFPDRGRKVDEGVPLYAIPGNHDWYDGLVQFLAYFGREQHTHFGNWRTRQRRSYFAIQLTETWWMWAIDIQLAEDMDQPQADYFTAIAKSKEMSKHSRIILCAAEPGWLYTDTNTRSWKIMDFAIGIAHNAEKSLTIPILISGDTHHYSRYASADGIQFITSGGGGAFLHPTHHLEQNVDLAWVGNKKELSLGTVVLANGVKTGDNAAYPSMAKSRALVWGNLWFAVTNWDFALLMGGIYFFVGVAVGLRDHGDTYSIIALLMIAGIVGYTTTQEKVSLVEVVRNLLRSKKYPDRYSTLAVEKLWSQALKAVIVWGTSLAHSAAHILTAIVAARCVGSYNMRFSLTGEWYLVWKWLALLLLEMGAIGLVVGSTIFGLNMLVTCRWLRMNRNDAFSSLRIGSFNNFLRIRIKDDTAELYAIGLEEVPERDGWEENLKYKRGNPDEPRWVAKDPLRPHIIEKVIVNGSVGLA
jgi:hypothetical protein